MSRARKLLEAEAGSKTLVIHKDDPSTVFLKVIYEGLGYPVITGNATPEELMQAIKAHDRVFMLGHGSPGGLFAADFLIDDRFGPELAKKRDGVYIWCNADAYAVRNKLFGLVSGMFISEVGEAAMFGIRATQEEVNQSNYAFSRAVRKALDTGAPPSTVRECYIHATCKITKFNNERLYVFENGTPTPELHVTSYGRPSRTKPTRPTRFPEEWEQWQQDLAKEREARYAAEDWWDTFEDLAVEDGFPLHTLEPGSYNYERVMDFFKQQLPPKEALDRLWDTPPEAAGEEPESEDGHYSGLP